MKGMGWGLRAAPPPPPRPAPAPPEGGGGGWHDTRLRGGGSTETHPPTPEHSHPHLSVRGLTPTGESGTDPHDALMLLRSVSGRHGAHCTHRPPSFAGPPRPPPPLGGVIFEGPLALSPRMPISARHETTHHLAAARAFRCAVVPLVPAGLSNTYVPPPTEWDPLDACRWGVLLFPGGGGGRGTCAATATA